MFKNVFTLKVRYRGADVSIGEGFCPPITGKRIERAMCPRAKGNRCVSRMCFQCENVTCWLYKMILNTYL
nr:MAG TPA: hypothetical protein [Caudoviricetes sp.]